MFARPILRALIILTLLLTASASWSAASLRTPHVTLTLETETASLQAGTTLWAGLRFELIPHWHVYWRNPGDSGEPPRVRWELPAGWQAGDIRWPVPQRIPVGPLVNYGYADETLLLVSLQVPETLPASGPVRIAAELSWLVCREECIPQSGRLEIELPVGPAAAAKSGVAARFEAIRSTWPINFPGQASYRTADPDALALHLRNTGWAPAQIEDLWFASESWGPIAASGEQNWAGDGTELVLTLPTGEAPLAPDAPLAGLLVITEQTDDGPLTRGFSIDASLGTAVDAGGDTASSSVTLWAAVGLALLGGLLLNLMPCVLPVLAIKVLGLVQHAQGGATRHGLAFSAGVLVSFGALAGALIALRTASSALGWGFQLQEPLVIVGLMFLMLAIGLNLSGVYQLGNGLAGIGQSLSERRGLAGTFATGVLAVVVASPCTAPFMGTALGYALTRPPGEALLVFFALGSGFALPMLALSIWPQWLRLIPPPGPWMERLRNGLAFPMYGAAAWLLWVLSQQVGAATLAAALSGAVLLAFALWWYGQPLHNRGRQLLVAVGLVAAGFGLAAWAAIDPAPADNRHENTGRDSERWSLARVEQLRNQGQAVLVNFTAAWCITCKVNEQVALSTERVQAVLDEHQVAYLKGDWTRRDAIIGAELQRHGRSGVPLYLLYPPDGGQPKILPQLLTERLVLQAIDNIHNEE